MKHSTFPHWLAAILIMGAAFAVRAISLNFDPIFYDEAQHVIRAQRIITGHNVLAGVDHNKWLYSLLLGLLNPTGPEAVWLGRFLNALFGLLTVAAVVRLGRQLASAATGLMAGAVYAVLPLAVFHERQALVDPMLTVLVTLSLICLASLARRWRWQVALGFCLLLILARLTKGAALPFLGMPFAAALLLVRGEPLAALGGRRGRLVALGVITATLTLGIAAGVDALAVQRGMTLLDYQRAGLGSLLIVQPLGAWLGAWLAEVGANLGIIWRHYWAYAGPLILLPALMAPFTAWGQQRTPELAFALTPPLLFSLALAIVDGPVGIPPRYLLMNTPTLIVAAGWGLAGLWHLLSGPRRQPLAWAVIGAYLALALGTLLAADVRLIAQPRTSPLNYAQNFHYGGWEQIATLDIIEAAMKAPDGDRLVVLSGWTPYSWIRATVGTRAAQHIVFDDSGDQQRRQMAAWLAEGRPILIVETGDDVPVGPKPYGSALTQTVAEFEVPRGGWQRVYQVTDAEGTLAREIYDVLGDNPDFMAADYAALGQAVQASPARLGLAFPPNHGSALAQAAPNIPAQPLEVATWPLSAAGVEAAVPAEVAEGEVLAVVHYDPPSTDPRRLVLSAFSRRLYSLGPEQWFGLLNVRLFAAGPAEPAYVSLGGEIEGVIRLDEAALSSAITAGQPLTVALRWSTCELVADDFSRYLHLINEAGELVAQADGTPAAGLHPTSAWVPGEVIEERVALLVPSDLPAGQYRLLAGLYVPASGLRLRVTAGPQLDGSLLLGTLSLP